MSSAALQKQAISLFAKFELAAERNLPLDDYALYLELEQGSLTGRQKIIAVATTVYLGIGHFGDFVGGVKEISSLSKQVIEQVTRRAREGLRLPQSALISRRSNAGDLTALTKLFEKVAWGEIQPEEAANRAMKLFGEPAELPSELKRDIAQTMETIKRYPQQLHLLDHEQVSLISEDTHQRRESTPRRQPVLTDSRNRIRVEVHKVHKNGAVRAMSRCVLNEAW